VPLNRYPVVSLASLRRRRAGVRTVLDVPGRVLTRSGRSALVVALRALGIGAGDRVLVPNYYCPTLVAPVEYVGARPVFYPLTANGDPDLDALAGWRGADRGRFATIATHLFGLPADLAGIRAWCDSRGSPLIEDCAHALFGAPDDGRPDFVGDFVTASLPKFVHTLEGGVVASLRGATAVDGLPTATLRDEAKAAWNAWETARAHARPAPPAGEAGAAPDPRPSPESVRREALADPLLVPAALRRSERWLVDHHDDVRMVENRRRTYAAMLERFGRLAGVRPLRPTLGPHAVPYVFPLLADEPDAAFMRIRAAGLPVFRWDRYWPSSTEDIASPVHPWGESVLQLACHQDVRPEHVEAYARALTGGA
jgi:perosamine synthetase